MKLEKGVDLLKANKNEFGHFVQITDTWLLQHGNKLKDMFVRSDESGDGVINYDEMKSG